MSYLANVAVALDLLPHLRRVRDHIDRHYTEPLTLDQLAAIGAVSKFHLVRSFAAAYGETPIRYLTRRRVERAQDLLRAANLTVSEVCFAVGSPVSGRSRRVSNNSSGKRRPGTGTGGLALARRTFPTATCSCGALSICGPPQTFLDQTKNRNLGEARARPPF